MSQPRDAGQLWRDPELGLAITACRATFEATRLTAPPTGIRWDRFLAVCERHRIQSLCWNALEPVSDELPTEFAQALCLRAKAIAETNLRSALESARLFRSFQEAGLSLLFLKGITLSAIAYRDPFLKMGIDIDLLVDRNQLADAAHLLRSAGYRAVIPADDQRLGQWHERRKESVWRSNDGDFQIDVHSRLADHPALLAGIDVNSPSQMVPIGAGITLPTLADDELFAYLCVHGASSAWFRLKWITDLAAFLSRKGPEEVERLYQRSQQFRSGRAADQALLLASRLYGTLVPEGLMARLAGSPVSRWLAHLAERQLANLREPTERLMGTATIHASQLGLLPGWRFKLSETARQLRDLTERGG